MVGVARLVLSQFPCHVRRHVSSKFKKLSKLSSEKSPHQRQAAILIIIAFISTHCLIHFRLRITLQSPY